MKKFLAILLSSGLIYTGYAATTNSSGTTVKQKHHKKLKKKKVSNKSGSNKNDPILDAINTKPTTTSKRKKPRPITPVVSSGIPKQPRLYSRAGYAVDLNTSEVLVSKNATDQMPIASITKLMTAMVMLDSGADMDEYITISEDDVDHLKNTFSRLRVGMQLRRRDLLLLALMSSENRAAYAIARTAYPGGINTFIPKMNAKAKALGMSNTQFFDPTGLTPRNRSTAIDLAKMVAAAYKYDLIREDTTTKGADVMLGRNYTHHYMNSDALVRTDKFQIEVSKTGFINEAGHCLVLYAVVDNRPIAMAFLNSAGKGGRLVDAMAVERYVDQMQ